MKSRNLLCLLVAFLLTAAGCGTGTVDDTPDENNVTTVQEPETENPNAIDDLPEGLSFEGAEFRFFSGDEYGLISTAEELTGEILNDTKYEMELEVENRLNVEISETPTPYWGMTSAVNNLITSGDTTYDAMSMTDRFSLQCAMQNAFLPMSEIEYVDLTKAYWGDKLSETLSIGGEYYFAVSSFNLRSYEKMACVLFNNTVADNYGIEVPFEAVHNGTWTFDLLESYGNVATNDANGDGVMDREDNYTYGTVDGRHIAAQFYISAGLKTVDKDENGIPVVVVYNNEKFYDVLERVRNIFFTENCVITEAEFYSTDLFRKDQELLSFLSFYSIVNFREMESSFSIVPTPKYDEKQPDYITRTYDVTFSMVPVTITDSAKAGAVMEALSSYGYKHLVPTYVETVLQDKYARDAESVSCIQIAFDTRTLDLGEAYLSEFFSGAFLHLLDTGGGIASHLQSIRNQVDSSLVTITEALMRKGNE